MPNPIQERILEATKKSLEKAEREGKSPKDPRQNNPNYDQWVKGHESGNIVDELTAPDSAGPSREAKSLASQVAKSDLRTYRKGNGQSQEVEIKAPSFTPIADLRGHYSVERDSEITPLGRRTDYFTNMLDVKGTDKGAFSFIREKSSTSGAGVRPENVDPDAATSSVGSSVAMEAIERTLRKFDTYIAVPVETMEDLGEFTEFLEGTLDHFLYLERDAQVWSGSGVGNNMHGFTTDADIATRAWSAGESGDNMADVYLRALTDLWVSGYQPDGIAIHDLDWMKIAMMKEAVNKNYLIPQAHIQENSFSLWGQPLTKTVVPTPGTSLVGAFSSAAKYRERHDKRVRMTDSHLGHFLTDIVFMKITARGGLGIKSGKAFKFVDLDAAPT